MNTRLFTLAALIGAPFMCIGVYVEAKFPGLGQPWWTGIWGLLYITGWLAGMEVMRRLRLTGESRFGKQAVVLVMVSLFVADISNVWQLVAPDYKPSLFWALDIFWPVSHVMMLFVGFATVRARALSRYQTWLPVAMGLWFPLTMALSQTPVVLHFSNIYSLFAWTLMALTLRQKASMQASNAVCVPQVA